MKHVPVPVTVDEDESVVRTLCKSPPWAAHQSAWLGAYTNYRTAHGDPWAVSPLCLGAPLESLQYTLYDNRKRGGPLRRIREMAGLLSCPVCGSPTIGSLDHYLPRTVFPEFSIMRANLVPACTHCNSGVKGSIFKGASSAERFIHPYFDKWADHELWHIEFIPPLDAVDFSAVPDPSLSVSQQETVRFHLQHVLGTQFKIALSNYWSNLPAELQLRASHDSSASVPELIDFELTVTKLTFGVNSWRAGFLRGLSADGDAIAHVAGRSALTS